MTKPYVGLTVQWFVRGNRQAPPLPAIVTVVHPGGMLSLSICDENSVWSTRRSVWHIDAPQVKSNHKLTEKAGAWDFAKPPEEPVANPAPVQEEQRPAPAAVSEEPKTREAIEVAKKKDLQKATQPPA